MNDKQLSSNSRSQKGESQNGSAAPKSVEIAPYQETVLAGHSDNGWAPPPVAESAPKLSGLRQILDLLVRRRKVVLPIFLIVVALGVVNGWSKRRVYQATATLLANTSPLGGDDKKAANDPLAGGDVEGVNQSRNLETQMEILRTPAVVRGAFQSLKPDQQLALRNFYSADIANTRNTDLITVSVTSYAPDASAALANAICQSYIELSQENNRREVGGTARFVKGQLETVRVQLNQARNDFRDFQQKNNITDVGIQSSTVNGTLNQIKADLRTTQNDLSSRSAQLRQLEASLSTVPREIVTQTTGTNNINETLRNKLTELKIARATALAAYTPTSTKVKDIDGQIARITTQLNAQPRTENTGVERAPNPTYTSLKEQVETARGDVTALGARLGTLRASLGKAAQDLTQLPAKTARFNQLNNSVSRLEDTNATLDQKYRALKINEEARLANASLQSSALAPGGPQSSSRAKSLLMAVAAGLALAYAAALLMDQFDDKVHNVEQAEAAGRLPVLLDVPYIKDNKQQCILSADSSFLLESFEMLTAQIGLAERNDPVKSVLLTSSLPGEGKSVTSVNLAIAAALSGQRVALVDCDLRQPVLHRFFDLPVERGFTDVVTSACTLEAAMQTTRIPRLDVLSGGSATKKPLELLRSPATRQTLDALQQSYDLLIIDSPPALLIADATILAAQTDATIMVVSCNEAARKEIGRATNLMWQTGAHLMGMVLTKVPAALGGSSSYVSYYGGNTVRDMELGEGEPDEASLGAQLAHHNESN